MRNPEANWRRRLRRDETTAGADGTGELPAVIAELVLLREENARLKAAQHQLPGLDQVLGRARSLPAGTNMDRDDVGDEATQLLIESLVTREALLELCDEIQRWMSEVRERLDALSPDTAGFALPSVLESHDESHAAPTR
jgi:transposase-like protein